MQQDSGAQRGCVRRQGQVEGSCTFLDLQCHFPACCLPPIPPAGSSFLADAQRLLRSCLAKRDWGKLAPLLQVGAAGAATSVSTWQPLRASSCPLLCTPALQRVVLYPSCAAGTGQHGSPHLRPARHAARQHRPRSHRHHGRRAGGSRRPGQQQQPRQQGRGAGRQQAAGRGGQRGPAAAAQPVVPCRHARARAGQQGAAAAAAGGGGGRGRPAGRGHGAAARAEQLDAHAGEELGAGWGCRCVCCACAVCCAADRSERPLQPQKRPLQRGESNWGHAP